VVVRKGAEEQRLALQELDPRSHTVATHPLQITTISFNFFRIGKTMHEPPAFSNVTLAQFLGINHPAFVQAEDFYTKHFSYEEINVTWRNHPLGLHLLPAISSLLYILMVYRLPGFLIRNKIKLPKHVIQPIMAGWNLFLSALSLCMFLGVIIPFTAFVSRIGLWHVICNQDNLQLPSYGTIVFWTAVFAYSKYFELVDTLLLILKTPERPVPFLHWYHHFTVLLFTWYAANFQLAVGLTFISMNALVHTFMYWYYFQKERGYDPIWAKPLTIGQITQMVFGLIFNAAWTWGYAQGYRCGCTSPKLVCRWASPSTHRISSSFSSSSWSDISCPPRRSPLPPLLRPRRSSEQATALYDEDTHVHETA